ncbi:unnamed protein product [Dibothriocephalus latus]|uniref:Uncharacterized protein n=1 Tax=Dibothriocephalus latus TaxID=60516 RepID=A0A3P7LVY4_DIBLA|nr:unnamed protein product [Dibothriocephalus latus]
MKCELIDCKKRINQLEEHPEAPEEEWEEGSVEEPFESFPFSLLTNQADIGVQVNTLEEDDFEKLVELNKKIVVSLLLLESERDALRLDLQKSNGELFEMSLQAQDAAIERELLQAEYREIVRQNTKETEEKARMTTPVQMETQASNTEAVTLSEKATQASIQVETTEERGLKKELTLTRHMVEDLQKRLGDRDRLIEILRKERNRLDQGDSLKQIKELKAKVVNVPSFFV